MNCFQYCRKYVFKRPWWTVYSWYCGFVLYCIVLPFNVPFATALHFSPCMVYETKMSLTVFHCHTILIVNVCRMLCKPMLLSMFIKMCVKLNHIHLASYMEVEKLASKINAALWETYIISKIFLKICTFSPWISFELLGFRLRKNYWTL